MECFGECGKKTSKRCSRCKLVFYCSRACQAKRRHEQLCDFAISNLETIRLIVAEQAKKFHNTSKPEVKLECLGHRHNFNLNKATVGPSQIHGTGVFATKDIEVGEIITMYPPHLCKFIVNNDRHVNGHQMLVYKSAGTPLQYYEDYCGSETKELDSYEHMFGSQYSIIGHPLMIDDSNCLAHMINDGAKEFSTKHKYFQSSHLHSNSQMFGVDNVVIGLMANKPIKAGDEIISTYGYEYWMTNLNRVKIQHLL